MAKLPRLADRQTRKLINTNQTCFAETGGRGPKPQGYSELQTHTSNIPACRAAGTDVSSAEL